jgi:anti-sigma regulatory factor (Ser/Thr protein kinase)
VHADGCPGTVVAVCDATPAAYLQLPLDERAVAAARRFLRAAVCEIHAAGVLDEAELLVSELVTNGVRYGAPPITVQVVCDGGARMRVLVSDRDATVPQQRLAGPEEESGRGMGLVDYLSAEWGIEPHGDGKTVWFSLAT